MEETAQLLALADRMLWVTALERDEIRFEHSLS